MRTRALVAPLLAPLLAFGMLALASCEEVQPKTQPSQTSAELKEVLAKIDDQVITTGEFQDRINKQSPFLRARYTSPERKKEFLDNLIRFEVLAKEATRRGFDKDPEVVRSMKQSMIQKLMRDEFETRVKLEDIKDPEMQKYYNEHNEQYNQPEQVRVSMIVVADRGRAQKLLAELGTKQSDPEAFRKAVTTESIDKESKERGGDLRYFGRDAKEVAKEIVDAAFALKNFNDLGGPVKVASGWAVLKLTGRRAELKRSFEEVKRQIQSLLYREKRTKSMEDYVAELKRKANVTVYEQRLSQVKVEAAPPSGMPGGMPGFPGMMPPSPGGMPPGGHPGMGRLPGGQPGMGHMPGGHPGMGQHPGGPPGMGHPHGPAGQPPMSAPAMPTTPPAPAAPGPGK